MKKTSYRLTFFLILICLLIVSFMWWRWIYLKPPSLNLVSIRLPASESAHPIDQLLKQHLRLLKNQPQLVQQFASSATLAAVADLWVDQCEVTQGDFAKFRRWFALSESLPDIAHPQQPHDWQYQSQTVGHKLLGRLDMPVSGVSYLDAHAYCSASGGRLPTASEFEALASGKEHRLYPWGNEVNSDILKTGWPFRDPLLNIRQCGKATSIATPEGIHDLGNNVLEWVSADGDKAIPALMGGNAFNRPVGLHALNIIQRDSAYDYRSQYAGFRCVYDRPAKLGDSSRQLPWNSISQVIAIPKGIYPIGVSPSAKIPQMLQRLQPKQYRQLEQLPIEQSPLHLRISRQEVQVKHYQTFLADPLVKLGFFNHKKQPQDIFHVPKNWQQQSQHPARPITSVNWWNAYAFTRWAGGRLPTDVEWKRIAGSDSTLYPWGNDYQIGRSIDRNHPKVGKQNDYHWQPRNAHLSDDATRQGIVGLAGNVAEWTSSVTHFGNGFHIIVKGGSYLLPSQANQILQTGAVSPDFSSDDLGFRLIKEP